MGHTYSSVVVHVVFGTKGCRRLIDDSFRQRLYEYLAGIARSEFGQALAIGGTENHIHGLLSMGTDITIGQAMSKWKALSSGWVHRQLGIADFAWQSGYGVFSVSKSACDSVKDYILQQQEHHRKLTFDEEFILLLQKHGVEFDPQAMWE